MPKMKSGLKAGKSLNQGNRIKPPIFAAMETFPTIYLKPKKEESLERRHPWVFSGAIKRTEGQPITGDMVRVCANKGRVLGFGHFSSNTSISVRMLSFDELPLTGAWWEDRIREAVQVRQDLGLLDGEQQNICRLIHAEGDGLSGLIVDYYDRVAVIQTHSVGMLRSLEAIVSSLKSAIPDLRGVYNKSQKLLLKLGEQDVDDGWILGGKPEDWLPLEFGRRFLIDLEQGQKTGFFIDQRENRTLLQMLSKGRRVLNVFSYTGGFSVAALKGGATEVHSLDSSRRALDLAEKAVILNEFDAKIHKSIEADAMEFLKSGVDAFDIVVLDPPAFAKSASARHQAVQGYKRINQRAIASMKPGALLFTFSCSQAVDDRLFTHTVISAAMQCNRTVRILYRLHQPADHPVSAFHQEGAYLKGLVLRID
jgi:23S rRNA (cytosine1962-C5)-methyltransferase